MTDLFTAPAPVGGDKLDLDNLVGTLLLIHVHDVEDGINTKFGITDAVRADVVALDGRQAGTAFDDTLIFPRILKSQLRAKIGEKVLGRLGKGTAAAGQSAPWVLNAATPADADLATKWLTRVATPAAPASTGVPPIASQANDETPPWAR